jgi:hypothetical protein
MTSEKFEALLQKQMPDDEKRRRADFVVDTSQSFDAARAQVRAILASVVAIRACEPQSDRSNQSFAGRASIQPRSRSRASQMECRTVSEPVHPTSIIRDIAVEMRPVAATEVIGQHCLQIRPNIERRRKLSIANAGHF